MSGPEEELTVMGNCYDELNKLDFGQQRRVINWLSEVFPALKMAQHIREVEVERDPSPRPLLEVTPPPPQMRQRISGVGYDKRTQIKQRYEQLKGDGRAPRGTIDKLAGEFDLDEAAIKRVIYNQDGY